MDESDDDWEKALDSLVSGDAKPLAALLRSESPMSREARLYIAELLAPETELLEHHLIVKASKQRTRLERKLKKRAEISQALFAEQAKGLSVPDAAEEVAEKLGVSDRYVLKIADRRNPALLYVAQRVVAEIIEACRLSGIGTIEEFMAELAQRLDPATRARLEKALDQKP